ncbi:hypothetical protein [Mastigocladopsis repens]|nr:hypothetical protein [Mastigocladopsis repens]
MARLYTTDLYHPFRKMVLNPSSHEHAMLLKGAAKSDRILPNVLKAIPFF